MEQDKRPEPTSIRLPKYLKDWLIVRSGQESRSLSGEIINLVKKAKQKEETKKKELETNG